MDTMDMMQPLKDLQFDIIKGKKKRNIATIKKVAQLIFQKFNEKFYVVGGAAVQIYGSDRVTHDVDLVIEPLAAGADVSKGTPKSNLWSDMQKFIPRNATEGNFAVEVDNGVPNMTYAMWYDKWPNPTETVYIELHEPSDFAAKDPEPQRPGGKASQIQVEVKGQKIWKIDRDIAIRDPVQAWKDYFILLDNWQTPRITLFTIPSVLLWTQDGTTLAPPTLILCNKLAMLVYRDKLKPDKTSLNNDLKDIDFLVKKLDLFNQGLYVGDDKLRKPEWTKAYPKDYPAVKAIEDGNELAMLMWNMARARWNEGFTSVDSNTKASWSKANPKIDFLPPLPSSSKG